MAKRIPVDEFAAVIKAREFVRKVNPAGIPVRVEAYVEEAKAGLRRQTDLGPDEPGWSFYSGGKHYICVNGTTGPNVSDSRSAMSSRTSFWVSSRNIRLYHGGVTRSGPPGKSFATCSLRNWFFPTDCSNLWRMKPR